MVKVSIIIVTNNSLKVIKDCLYSVFTQDYTDFEVIVVDNNSIDGTKEFIKEYFPQVKLIENKKNLGFCWANNRGIEASQGEYILTLNSDVVLEKNFLTELMKVVENTPKEIGMFSPKILKMDKKTIDSTGIILSKARRFYNRGSGEIELGQYDNRREIFGPSAACALYKRGMLNEIRIDSFNIRANSIKIRDNSCIEYFDNDFFFLVEDVDLAWRANLRGFRGYFVPTAIGYHLGNSSGINRKTRQYLSFRNRYLMMLKNEQLGELIKNLGYICFYDILRFFYLMITNPLVPKAVLEIIYLFRRMWKKRRHPKY